LSTENLKISYFPTNKNFNANQTREIENPGQAFPQKEQQE
jgi:hypothetical protein